MAIAPSEHDWLPSPRTQFFDDEHGQHEVAFVELRTGKAHRVEQPDTNRLVYLYVGSDGLPVGVKLLQPIPATLRAFLFGRLVAVTNGLPRSDRGGGYRLSPTPGDAFMDAAMSEVLRASTALERSPRMAPPPA